MLGLWSDVRSDIIESFKAYMHHLWVMWGVCMSVCLLWGGVPVVLIDVSTPVCGFCWLPVKADGLSFHFLLQNRGSSGAHEFDYKSLVVHVRACARVGVCKEVCLIQLHVVKCDLFCCDYEMHSLAFFFCFFLCFHIFKYITTLIITGNKRWGAKTQTEDGCVTLTTAVKLS